VEGKNESGKGYRGEQGESVQKGRGGNARGVVWRIRCQVRVIARSAPRSEAGRREGGGSPRGGEKGGDTWARN